MRVDRNYSNSMYIETKFVRWHCVELSKAGGRRHRTCDIQACKLAKGKTKKRKLRMESVDPANIEVVAIVDEDDEAEDVIDLEDVDASDVLL